MTDEPEANGANPDPLPTRVGAHAHPVDLPGNRLVGGQPLRWTSLVIATVTLFLALTDAASLHGWAAELAPSPWSAWAVDATARWEALTERAGLAAPRAALHARWKRAQAARFGAEAPGDPR